MSLRSRSAQASIASLLFVASSPAFADDLPPLPQTDAAPPAVQIEEPAHAPAAPPTPPPASPAAHPSHHWRGAPPVVLLPPSYARLPEEEEDNSQLGTRQRFIRFEVGARVRFIGDDAFDAFSTDNRLPQISLGGSTVLFTHRSFSFAAGIGFDAGATKATSRSFKMELNAYHATVPLEGRYHFTPWLFGFAKAAPGIASIHAEANEFAGAPKLTATSVAFAADLSVGASFLIGAQKHPQRHAFRFWLTPEFGYGIATNASMNLEADDARYGSLNLPGLSLGGFFGRASAGFGF